MQDLLAEVASAASLPFKKPSRIPHGAARSICLVGGQRLIRWSISQVLSSKGLKATASFEDLTELAGRLKAGASPGWDAIIVLLCDPKPFGTCYQIQEALQKAGCDVPVVVLSDKVSRGQVYAALRAGAKAYISLQSDPEELRRGIEMAAAGKVYLSQEAVSVLVNDISASPPQANGAPKLRSVELSKREIQVVQLLCEGNSAKEVARRLHISAKTVENHRYNIYRKCEVDSIAALMRYAIQHGMVSL